MRRRFGAHLSTADGLKYAAINARALGVEAMQIMLGEGYSWSPYKLADNVVNEFRKLTYGVAVYVHLPYTINPCVPKGHPHYNLQRAAMRRYLELSDACGATAVVMHPGYKKELTETAARSNFVSFMDIVQGSEFDCRILFETDSGAKNGSKIGSPEFISYALAKLGRTHFGMCIDTEHLFARGVDLWDDQVRSDFLGDYQELIELVHLNAPDPGVELGSFIDRHSIGFSDYEVPSESMIKDLVLSFPAVLERKSLVVIERDLALVNALVPPVPVSIEPVLEEEVVENGARDND